MMAVEVEFSYDETVVFSTMMHVLNLVNTYREKNESEVQKHVTEFEESSEYRFRELVSTIFHQFHLYPNLQFYEIFRVAGTWKTCVEVIQKLKNAFSEVYSTLKKVEL